MKIAAKKRNELKIVINYCYEILLNLAIATRVYMFALPPGDGSIITIGLINRNLERAKSQTETWLCANGRRNGATNLTI